MGVIGLGRRYDDPLSRATPGVRRIGAASATGQGGDTPAGAGGRTTVRAGVVELSGTARLAAAQAKAPSFADLGRSARAKLDAAIQDAADRTGSIAPLVNIQAVDFFPYYAVFSDQELAAMAHDPAGVFSQAEQDQAVGVLANRVKISYEAVMGPALAGDKRAHAGAVLALHERMSPEIREALGWTPAMIDATRRMQEQEEREVGKLHRRGILTDLWLAQGQGGLACFQPGEVPEASGLEGRAPGT